MSKLVPTQGILKNAKNINQFISKNKAVFWAILKPLLPWVIGLHAFDTLIAILFYTDAKESLELGAIIALYFYTVLAISWHRVVIQGPKKAIPMNPFKPQKHELVFIGMSILLFMIGGFFLNISAIIVVFFLAKVSIGLALIVLILLIIGSFYIAYKCLFYFPAKAVNNSITLRKSWAITQGYSWKLGAISFIASFKVLLGAILYIICITLIIDADNNTEIHHILSFIMSLPILIYFVPIFSIIWVTTLSNYFMHALRYSPNRVKVKICGLSTPATLTAAIEHGVDYIGLVFYPPSPRHVNMEVANYLASFIPKNITTVGLFVDPDDKILEEALNAVPLNIIQLHGNEAPERVAEIKDKFDILVMKAIPVSTKMDIESASLYEGIADWILFDAKGETLPGGNGIAFDWALLSQYKGTTPWMLAGGLTPDNVSEALSIASPHAVDVSSGVETAKGVKNVAKIHSFLKAVKQA